MPIFIVALCVLERLIYHTPTNALLYRVIHKSVKQFQNSQQIDYATDHGNSYVDRERNC